MKFSLLAIGLLIGTNCVAQTLDSQEGLCANNDANACNQVGLLYLNGKGVSQSFETARSYFDHACRLNNQDGCTNLGNLYKNGQGVKKSLQDANNYFKIACDFENGFGCFSLATSYYAGQGFKKNLKTAFDLFTKSCNLNYGQGCVAVGNMYKDGESVKASMSTALQFYQLGCDRGSGSGCSTLARMNYNGTGVPKSFEKAASYYYQACVLDVGRSCNNLGHMYEDGTGVTKSNIRAHEFYEKACDLDSGQGCISLGSILFRGPENQNYEAANKAFAKACDLGVGLACNYLANDYQSGLGIEQSASKAKEIYEKACKQKIGLSCFRLGLLAEYGPAGASSYAQARNYYEQSCNYKDPSGCEKVGQMYQDGEGVEASPEKANEYFARAKEYSAVLQAASGLEDSFNSLYTSAVPITDKQFSDAYLKLQADCSQLSEDLNKASVLHLTGFNLAPSFYMEGLNLSKAPGSTKEKIEVKVNNVNIPACDISYTKAKGFETELNYEYLANQLAGKIPQHWSDFINLRLQAQKGSALDGSGTSVADNQTQQLPSSSPTVPSFSTEGSSKSEFDGLFDDLDDEIDAEFDKLERELFGTSKSYAQNSPAPSSSGNRQALNVPNNIQQLVAAPVDTSLQPKGELYNMFKFGSNYTDLQRKKKLSEIAGKVVVWTLPVYEVREKGKGTYEIQCSGDFSTARVDVYLTPRNQAEVDRIYALKTGNRITVKGVLLGETTFARDLIMRPAIFWNT